MANPIEFRACEVWLCQVLGEQLCRVWLQDPRSIAYDDSMAVTIDLEKTPSVHLPSFPDNVQVDDFLFPEESKRAGLSTLGPRWPRSHRGDSNAHPAAAALWLEASFWERKKQEGKLLSHPQSTSTSLIQWASRLYFDAANNWRRYLGCRARWVSSNVDGTTTFLLWKPLDLVPTVTVKLRLGNDADHDTNHPWTGGQGDGTLFVRWTLLQSANFVTPKLPIGEADGAGGRFPAGELPKAA